MATGIEGEIPFEESIKIPGMEEGSDADVNLVVLSASAKLIDSMNFIYKAQIMAYITVEKIEDLEAVTGTDNQNIMIRHKNIEGLSIVANKTDTFRINDRLSVSSGKPGYR